MMATHRVCIVGIRGEMGDWFRRYYDAAEGFSVYGIGRLTRDSDRAILATGADGEVEALPLTLEQGVREADVVILSTPLLQTPALIRRYATWSEPGQVWCDFASIKSHIFADGAYDAVRADEVLTVHPVFAGEPRQGPVSAQGRLFVFCRHRGERGYALLRNDIVAAGADVVETTWQEHDRFMAVVQGLTHANAIALGLALQRLGLSTEDVGRFSSPVFRLFATISQRVLSRQWDLYAGIQFANRENVDVLEAYIDALQRLVAVVRDSDDEDGMARFRGLFDEARTAMREGRDSARAGDVDRIQELLSRSL